MYALIWIRNHMKIKRETRSKEVVKSRIILEREENFAQSTNLKKLEYILSLVGGKYLEVF